MKKTVLLLLIIGFGNTAFSQDLSNCKKTCTQDKLVETGAFLGVRILTAENNIHAKVMEVIPNTAAERNHFAINDVITKIDGITVKGYLHIVELIQAHQPHDVIKIEYIHDNKTRKKRVALGPLHTKIVTEVICCDEPAQVKPKATNKLLPMDVRFTLYPNPAVNKLQITSDLLVSGKVVISIFDMLGNQLLSKEINESNGVLNQNINIENFVSGNYIVKITNNDIESVAKLVVTK